MSSFPTVTPPSPAWRPLQWAQTPMVLITAPAGSGPSPSFYTTDQGQGSAAGMAAFNAALGVVPTSTLPQAYAFDAVVDAEHAQVLTKTMHPVQTSVAISSHAYLEPATLILNVLMSDAVAAYTTVPQTTAPYIQPWTGNASKSVAAYTQILALQALRVPLTVTTRLRTYTNMLITQVAPREDATTISGARFRVEFSQIFIADVQATAVSARPDETQTNDLGAINPQDVPATTTTQFSVPKSTVSDSLSRINTPGAVATSPGVTTVNVPGAGSFTSAVQQFVSTYLPGAGGI